MKYLVILFFMAFATLGVQAQSATTTEGTAEAVEATTTATDVEIPASAIDAGTNDEMKAKSCHGSAAATSGRSCCAAKKAMSGCSGAASSSASTEQPKKGCSGTASSQAATEVPAANVVTEVDGRDDE